MMANFVQNRDADFALDGRFAAHGFAIFVDRDIPSPCCIENSSAKNLNGLWQFPRRADTSLGECAAAMQSTEVLILRIHIK